MPFIEEDTLLDLYKEIDISNKDKEQFRKSYLETKQSSIRMSSTLKWVIGTASFVCIALLTWLSYLYSYPEEVLTEKAISNSPYVASLKDSINSIDYKLDKLLLKYNSPDIQTLNSFNQVVYKVQVASYRQAGLNREGKKSWEIGDNNYFRIAIGDFPTYAQATAFKKELKKVGFSKDIFLIAIYRGEKIDIKEALSMSNKQLTANAEK